MSFSRSKRFDENKVVTPGPGYYENGWGTIGSDSIKFKIHATPRFLERCKKIGKQHRKCIECTCVDIVTKKSSEFEFLFNTAPNCAVQNITLRGRNPNSVELRKMLCDLILFRRKFCNDQMGDAVINEKLSMDNFHEDTEEDQLSVLSTSSSGEDSGFSSPTVIFESKNKQEHTYDSDCCNKFSLSHQVTQDKAVNLTFPKSVNASILKLQKPLNTRKTLIKKVRFLGVCESDEEQTNAERNDENAKCFFLNDKNGRNVNHTSKTSSFHSDINERRPNGLMKILESILDGESKLDDRISDKDLRKIFIFRSLLFLENILMKQNEKTARILAMVSMLEKEAMMLPSDEKFCENHFRYLLGMRE